MAEPTLAQQGVRTAIGAGLSALDALASTIAGASKATGATTEYIGQLNTIGNHIGVMRAPLPANESSLGALDLTSSRTAANGAAGTASSSSSSSSSTSNSSVTPPPVAGNGSALGAVAGNGSTPLGGGRRRTMHRKGKKARKSRKGKSM